MSILQDSTPFSFKDQMDTNRLGKAKLLCRQDSNLPIHTDMVRRPGNATLKPDKRILDRVDAGI